jgi:hypothetical protein
LEPGDFTILVAEGEELRLGVHLDWVIERPGGILDT